MKKVLVVFLSLLLILPTIHIHDKDCGYNPETNSGCKYEEVYEPEDKWNPEG